MLHRRHFLQISGGVIALAPQSVFASRKQELIKIGGIYTVPVHQRWVKVLHGAALNLVVRGEVKYQYVENVRNQDYERILQRLSEAKVDLIIGDAFAHEESARLIAQQFPKMTYLMGSAYQTNDQFSNFSVFDSYIQDASYLSGIIGASLSKTGKICLIGRYSTPAINRLMNAFIGGTKELSTDLDIRVDFQDSWYDLERAAEITNSRIAGGVDVIYADAPGVAETASESGIPVIGSMGSMDFGQASTVVTAARWHLEPTLQAAIDRMRSGGLVATDFGIYSYMRHNGCSLTPGGSFPYEITEDAMERTVLREIEMRERRFTASLDIDPPHSALFRALE